MANREALEQTLLALAGGSGLCVAFSGGVDSALLVKVACDAGIDVYAVTFHSTLLPAGDLERAAGQAAIYGARHAVLCVDPLEDDAVRYNGRERCYHCKRAMFLALRDYAAAREIGAVADGTNADDLLEYRPGLRALQELGIESPLARLGFTKAEVRALAAELGLDVAERPSSPCLATRFPYGAELTAKALQRCGDAESVLKVSGFPVVRARIHGDLVRIEVPARDLPDVLERGPGIEEALRRLGYRYVTLDLAGYRSGCYDALGTGEE